MRLKLKFFVSSIKISSFKPYLVAHKDEPLVPSGTGLGTSKWYQTVVETFFVISHPSRSTYVRWNASTHIDYMRFGWPYDILMRTSWFFIFCVGQLYIIIQILGNRISGTVSLNMFNNLVWFA